jgi:hypothetical protein
MLAADALRPEVLEYSSQALVSGLSYVVSSSVSLSTNIFYGYNVT